MSISDTTSNKLTRIQKESTNLVYKVAIHVLDTIEGIFNYYKTMPSGKQSDFFDYQSIVFDGIVLQVTYMLPLILDDSDKSIIASKLITYSKYMTSAIDRFYVMNTCLRFELTNSLLNSQKNSESFSFKTESWFITFIDSHINCAKSKASRTLWEEELFLCLIECCCYVKNKFVKFQKEDSNIKEMHSSLPSDPSFLIESWLKLAFDVCEK